MGRTLTDFVSGSIRLVNSVVAVVVVVVVVVVTVELSKRTFNSNILFPELKPIATCRCLSSADCLKVRSCLFIFILGGVKSGSLKTAGFGLCSQGKAETEYDTSY